MRYILICKHGRNLPEIEIAQYKQSGYSIADWCLQCAEEGKHE